MFLNNLCYMIPCVRSHIFIALPKKAPAVKPIDDVEPNPGLKGIGPLLQLRHTKESQREMVFISGPTNDH